MIDERQALLEMRTVEPRITSKAHALNPLRCAEYGETTMTTVETHTRRFQRRVLGIPCFTALEGPI
jgi:hypothetical protein